MELSEKIKKPLEKIDFVKRYEELSSKYALENVPSAERLVLIDGEEVMGMISELGYSPLFDSKEKFYKIKDEHIGDFSFRVHVILRDGLVELVWVVKENDKLLLGSPWGTYSRRLIDPGYRIKQPAIRNYDDLEDILKVSFMMYEDFKKALTE